MSAMWNAAVRFLGYSWFSAGLAEKGNQKGKKGSRKGTHPGKGAGPAGPLGTVVCTHCGKNGHTVDVCRSKARETKVCTYCQSLGLAGLGHLVAECRKKKAAAGPCTRCGVKGHAPSKCSYKEHVCEQCGTKGHSTAACWHLKSPTKAAAAAAAAATAAAPTPAPELSADSWRCKGCGVFNADPASKACGGCKKQRPKEDVEKAAQAFPMLKKVGTEVVDRIEAYTGGEYPISQEDQGKIDMAKKLQRHIDALKADDLPTALLEEQLKAIKLPDVANKALVDKKDMDARLLEIAQKAATARTQRAAALVKSDQKEQDEVDTLEKEITAWTSSKRNLPSHEKTVSRQRRKTQRTVLPS